jgi:cell division protein FtsL
MSLRMLIIALLVLAVIGSSIGVVYTRHRHRQAFISISSE